MNKMCNNIINRVLETEDHVSCSPLEKEDFCFKVAFLIKEEIRRHKWIEGENNRALSWEEAKNEWLSLYRDAFMNSLKSSLKIKRPKTRTAEKLRNGYKRREPVITGGLV